MIILNESHIKEIGVPWTDTISMVEKAVRCLDSKDFAQPVKPYLRYRDPQNRIIAMPAFVGGAINMAGIKWISSFPKNINNRKPRAHSVVILNDADTGEPVSIINTALLSVIRTASVSGLMMKYYDEIKSFSNVSLGIIGFGPIGQYHLQMCRALFEDKIDQIYLYDIRDIGTSTFANDDKIKVVDRWEEAYLEADIFITCTVSDAPYIDRPPKPGSLHLNVSLRDYKVGVYDWFKEAIIIDDWEEVCREKTDIEMMHLEKGLDKEGTYSIVDVVVGHCLKDYADNTPIMFNPMGMAVFDIAIGSLYYQVEKQKVTNGSAD